MKEQFDILLYVCFIWDKREIIFSETLLLAYKYNTVRNTIFLTKYTLIEVNVVILFYLTNAVVCMCAKVRDQRRLNLKTCFGEHEFTIKTIYMIKTHFEAGALWPKFVCFLV